MTTYQRSPTKIPHETFFFAVSVHACSSLLLRSCALLFLKMQVAVLANEKRQARLYRHEGNVRQLALASVPSSATGALPLGTHSVQPVDTPWRAAQVLQVHCTRLAAQGYSRVQVVAPRGLGSPCLARTTSATLPVLAPAVAETVRTVYTHARREVSVTSVTSIKPKRC